VKWYNSKQTQDRIIPAKFEPESGFWGADDDDSGQKHAGMTIQSEPVLFGRKGSMFLKSKPKIIFLWYRPIDNAV
jgi:hypothetical protein